jgi:hypothetical protein
MQTVKILKHVVTKKRRRENINGCCKQMAQKVECKIRWITVSLHMTTDQDETHLNKLNGQIYAVQQDAAI